MRNSTFRMSSQSRAMTNKRLRPTDGARKSTIPSSQPFLLRFSIRIGTMEWKLSSFDFEKLSQTWTDEIAAISESHDAKFNKDSSSSDLKDWKSSDRRASFDSIEAVQSLAAPEVPDYEKSFDPPQAHATESTRRSYSRSSSSLYSQSTEWSNPITIKPIAHEQRHMSLQIDETLISDGKFLSFDESEPDLRLVHRQTWAPSTHKPETTTQHSRIDSLQPQSPESSSRRGSFESISKPWLEGRPRPTSFATYHTRDRSKGRIASSRGQKLNSLPNFSRPISRLATDTIGGARLGVDNTQQRYADVEVASPLPMSPARLSPKVLELSNDMVHEERPQPRTSLSVEGNSFHEERKPERKMKNRWSTIPNMLKFNKRRSSITFQEHEKQANLDELRSMNPAVYNSTNSTQPIGDMAPYATEAASRRSSAVNLLPTPQHSPLGISFDKSLRPPFAPWAGVPPSPPPSLNNANRRKSSLGLSPTTAASQLRTPTEMRPTSLHSRKSSTLSSSMASPTSNLTHSRLSVVVPPSPRTSSRRSTPLLERTCILCKASKEHSEFSERRITSNCWHETSTCLTCLQAWVEQHLDERTRCACPECGEAMAYGDVSAFATDALGHRADGRHWV
jgi:hypothetical protein